jgi:hypothetical protein
VINAFVEMANAKLAELAEAGKRRRKAAKEAAAVLASNDTRLDVCLAEPLALPVIAPEVTAVMQVVGDEAQQASEALTHVVADDEAAIKTKKRVPTTLRGSIVAMGFGERDGTNGPYRTFCVSVRDVDGVIEEVRGAQLRTACLAAGVEVGDFVTIKRVGKRTSDVPGRSATNLYEVACSAASAEPVAG